MGKLEKHIAWGLATALMLILVMPVIPVDSQVVTATLMGTVKDTSGVVIPNARIIATNTATGIAHSTTTDSSGNYSIS